MPKLRIIVLATVVATACTAPDNGVTSEKLEEIPRCPISECGNSGNSPVIAGVYFWTLHSGGLANSKQVRIITVRRSDDIPMKLTTVDPGDWLAGVDPNTNLPIAQHAALENTRIYVAVAGKTYRIRIGHVSRTGEPFWVDPSPIETYEFYYTPIEDLPDELRHPDGTLPEDPLCSLANNDPSNPMIRAIVFAGDIYDPDTKAITTGSDADGWFNVACEGGAPYKMHKIGHTSVAQARLGISTSLDKRRAMLNAWTMNACGTGEAFTHPGEPITIEEAPDLLPVTSEYRATPVSREAVWGPKGALCLDTPRLDEEDRDIWLKIQEGCGGVLPPPCANFPVGPLGDHVLTGNPAE